MRPAYGRKPIYYPDRRKEDKKKKRGDNPQEILKQLDQKIYRKLTEAKSKLWNSGVRNLPLEFDEEALKIMKWYYKEKKKADEQIKCYNDSMSKR